jgi:hypothetical protein
MARQIIMLESTTAHSGACQSNTSFPASRLEPMRFGGVFFPAASSGAELLL